MPIKKEVTKDEFVNAGIKEASNLSIEALEMIYDYWTKTTADIKYDIVAMTIGFIELMPELIEPFYLSHGISDKDVTYIGESSNGIVIQIID